jgi:hypothetical protein
MKKTEIFPIFYPIGAKYYNKTTPEFKEAYGKPGVYIIFRMKQNDILPVYVGQGKGRREGMFKTFLLLQRYRTEKRRKKRRNRDFFI